MEPFLVYLMDPKQRSCFCPLFLALGHESRVDDSVFCVFESDSLRSRGWRWDQPWVLWEELGQPEQSGTPDGLGDAMGTKGSESWHPGLGCCLGTNVDDGKGRQDL